jgi:hypothetical protein
MTRKPFIQHILDNTAAIFLKKLHFIFFQLQKDKFFQLQKDKGLKVISIQIFSYHGPSKVGLKTLNFVMMQDMATH